MLARTRGFAARLGITKPFEMDVGNAVSFKLFREGRLGESGLAG